MNHDVCAGLSQSERDLAPQALARAGDERDLICERHFHGAETLAHSSHRRRGNAVKAKLLEFVSA